jgi:hypothetical protein
MNEVGGVIDKQGGSLISLVNSIGARNQSNRRPRHPLKVCAQINDDRHTICTTQLSGNLWRHSGVLMFTPPDLDGPNEIIHTTFKLKPFLILSNLFDIWISNGFYRTQGNGCCGSRDDT